MCVEILIDGKVISSVGELRKKLGREPVFSSDCISDRPFRDEECLCSVDISGTAKMLGVRPEFDGVLWEFHVEDRPPMLTVKRLEWVESAGILPGQMVWRCVNRQNVWIVKHADTKFIWCDAVSLEFAQTSPVRGQFDSLEDAKTAVQMDHESRAFAALDDPWAEEMERLAMLRASIRDTPAEPARGADETLYDRGYVWGWRHGQKEMAGKRDAARGALMMLAAHLEALLAVTRVRRQDGGDDEMIAEQEKALAHARAVILSDAGDA